MEKKRVVSHRQYINLLSSEASNVIRPQEYNVDLPMVMSFHLSPHLPRLVSWQRRKTVSHRQTLCKFIYDITGFKTEWYLSNTVILITAKLCSSVNCSSNAVFIIITSMACIQCACKKTAIT